MIIVGVGGGLVMFAPFRIVTENTKYAMPEIAIGLYCDSLAPYYLSRLDGHLGKFLTMTGTILKGEDVLLAGLGTQFVLSSYLEELEERMTKEQDFSLNKIDNIIQEYAVTESHKPQDYTLNKETRSIIDRCFKFETAEEIIDALQNDSTEFASDTAKTILDRSPTCTKINVKNFNIISEMSFVDTIKSEFKLWDATTKLPDFSEGVHSRMILKQQPISNPDKLEDVALDYVKKAICQDRTDVTPPFPHDVNFTPQLYLKYVLLTRDTILEAQREHNLSTIEDTVKWFQAKFSKEFGMRQKIESLI